MKIRISAASLVAMFVAAPFLCGTMCPMDPNMNNNQNQNQNQNQNSNSNDNTNDNDNNNSNDNSAPQPVFGRIYGDGSAGAKTVSSDENWNTQAHRQDNIQFTDLIIEEGVTLIIPSGMTIRCKGKFINYGTLFVRHGAEGGFSGRSGPGGPSLSTVITPPALGIATRTAQAGEIGDSSLALLGGAGGAGLSEFEARVIFRTGTNAGSGGAVGGMDTDGDGVSLNRGAEGGGSVVIIAEDEIINTGTILADGQDGNVDGGNDLGGGGGGGVVILASTTKVTNEGTISATGGDGEDADSNNGPSGGGGGGIIHLMAPEIENTGNTDVSGGAAGTDDAMITSDAMRYAGGGGGAAAGAGGQGGSIPDGAGPIAPGAAASGNNGFSFESKFDPQSIL